jgi:hypothetical protein
MRVKATLTRSQPIRPGPSEKQNKAPFAKLH